MAPGQQMPNPGQPAPQAPPQAPVNNKPRNPNSTQNTLLIAELREGMVIMNDGSFRAVVSCQSINFDLMSAKEREGVEYSYQSFLNSLYFPIQIFVRSQKVDIGPYMERLAKIRRDQDNMLLGVLMDDYMAFIDALSQETNIMDKDFYVVVPYYPTGDVASIANSSKGLFSGIFKPDQRKIVTIDQTTYTKAKEEIGNRVNAVMSGLYQLGIKSAQLSTKQLGELYYNVYNPDTAVREPMNDFDKMTSTYVGKGQGMAPQPGLNRELQ
jgi:type IV secretory pathway VirB4 component